MLFGSFRLNSGFGSATTRDWWIMFRAAPRNYKFLSRNRFPIYIFYAYEGDSMKVILKRSYIQFYLANAPILPYFLRLMKDIFLS